MNTRAFAFFSIFFLWVFTGRVQAQDTRTQYPKLLSNAYFGVNLGYINYPFTNANLAPGFQAQHVKVPHLAIRITLFGYRFNEHLSAQITYMRPFNWVEYENVNHDSALRSVWMNVGGLTLKGSLPLAKKLSLFGEAGLGLVTRNGFNNGDTDILKDVSYASLLAGGGLQYNLNTKWSVNLSAAYSPERKNVHQPHTIYFSGGFIYHMQPLSTEKVERNASSGYIFPKNLLQLAYTTNALGYGVNTLVSEGAVPIFWGGEASLKNGFAINYQRNIFHTRKVFSLDLGSSFGYWQTRRRRERFITVSVYPMLRFTAIRTRPLDVYLNYSVAGPSFISRVDLDGKDTGKKFTFRDFMGLGLYAGKNRNINAEINIGHFSNGNIFPSNAGVRIPLSFNLGYAF